MKCSVLDVVGSEGASAKLGKFVEVLVLSVVPYHEMNKTLVVNFDSHAMFHQRNEVKDIEAKAQGETCATLPVEDTMNPQIAERLGKILCDLQASQVNVLQGLDPVLFINDIDKAERDLQTLRMDIFQSKLPYQRAE